MYLRLSYSKDAKTAQAAEFRIVILVSSSRGHLSTVTWLVGVADCLRRPIYITLYCAVEVSSHIVIMH